MREPGYYWVRDSKNREWLVAQWLYDGWWFPGSRDPMLDPEVMKHYQIDERRITR